MKAALKDQAAPANKGNAANSALPRSDGPTVTGAIVAVVVLTAALVGLGRLWGTLGGKIATGLIPPLVALAGTAVWLVRRILYRWLTSLPFAVAILGVLLLATALGTIVLQGVPREMLVKRHGEFVTKLVYTVGLHDIFHAFAFKGLLAVLAVAMALVTVKRHAWRVPEWGFLLAHLGVIVILIGGLIGNLSGFKGWIDLYEGRTEQFVTIRDAFGRPTKEKVPMGFGIRLDKFELDKYPLEYRMYVYRKEAAGVDEETNEPKFRYKAVSSHKVADAKEWKQVKDTTSSFRILASYPDFQMTRQLEERPAGEGVPALQLRFFAHDGRGTPATLLAGVRDRDRMVVNKGTTAIQFVWEFDEKNPPVTAEKSPERHRLSYQKDHGAPPEERDVKIGETLRFGSVEVVFREFIPDFLWDSKNRKAYARSQEPNNPAILVSAGGKDRWLFANMPEHGHEEGQVHLVYSYLAAREPAEREIVVVGKTGEIFDYQKGVLQGKSTLKLGGDEGSQIVYERLLSSAEETHKAITRSQEWKRPVVEVELMIHGETQREYLPAGNSLPLDEAGTVLVFDKRSDDVKAYRSLVTLIDQGQAVRSGAIAVNSPLTYRGYSFYQSNFNPENFNPDHPDFRKPKYTGLLVVKDPGLSTVYAGFAMISLGVIFMFYLRPLILRRRIEAKRARLTA